MSLLSVGPICIAHIQIVWVNVACTKTLFNLWAEAIINVRNVSLCAKCAIFLLKIEPTPFSFRLVLGFTFMKRGQNQFKMLLEMSYVLAIIASTKRNASLLVVMYQLRDPFMAVENVEPGCLLTKFLLRYKCTLRQQKQTKHAFSLLKNMLPDKQLFIDVPFQSTKYGKKELCVNNIKTIGDVYCPTCRNEKCVYISTNKMTSFYDCKKCKAYCHVLNRPFKDQKPTIMLFGGDGTHCFARKTSRGYEKEKPSPFLKNFLRQPQPSTSEPEPKRLK